MRALIALLLAGIVHAQPSLRPLHVSPVGLIVDDSGKPVALRGLSRSGTGSGNADATATDQDYAAQSQLLSINLVRLFVNAAWWNANVQVPIAGTGYQNYIDTLIQRAKKYGNYVVIVKAGQFPDPPCGADGKACPAANQGDLNCQANASLCAAQDTTGNSIDAAFTFWSAFAKKYAADPAVLYDTWEDMHGIDDATWSDDQNQLIAAIRTYNPQALIFVEDTGTAFESIVAGKLADLSWANLVWNFHLFAGPAAGCQEPASPRYANWPQNFDPLASFARQYGHGAAILEWGGCNDSEPYHSALTSYAQAHGLALAYFDNTALLTQTGTAWQLTLTGTKVAQAYAAIASAASPANNGGPALRPANPVQDAINNRASIVPGGWVSVYGSNLSDIIKDWSDQDFSNGLPTSVAGIQVLVNGTPAPVWYVFPGQVNFQALGNLGTTATITVVRNGVASASATVNVVNASPGVLNYSRDYVTFYPNALFNGTTTIVGDPTLFGNTVKKARPGDILQVYVTGLAPTQSGVAPLSAIPFTAPVTVNIGSASVPALAAAQVFPGCFQVNFTVPNLTPGNYPFTVTANGATSQGGVVLVVGP